MRKYYNPRYNLKYPTSATEEVAQTDNVKLQNS